MECVTAYLIHICSYLFRAFILWASKGSLAPGCGPGPMGLAHRRIHIYLSICNHIYIHIYIYISIFMHTVCILYNKCLEILQNGRHLWKLIFWYFVWWFWICFKTKLLFLICSIVLDRSWSPKAMGKRQHVLILYKVHVFCW